MSEQLEIINFTINKALELGAEMCQANLVLSNKYELNADNRALTVLRTYDKVSLNVNVIKGKRKGAAVMSKTDRDSIAAGLKTAIANTDHVPADDALDIYPFREPENFLLGDEKPNTDAILLQLQDFVKELRQEYPKINLSTTVNSFDYEQAFFGNSNGLRLSSSTGLYVFVVTFMAKEQLKATSFNYAVALRPRPLGRLLDIEQVQRNLYNSERSIDPKPVPASFKGDVIFSPESCGDFVQVLLNSLSGNAIFAKSSPYIDSIGEMIASPELTIVGYPASNEFPNASHYGAYGAPMAKFPIVNKGRLENHLVNFYFGTKLERPITCDGDPGIEVKPGHMTVEELIANTERGILLGRFSGGNPNANLDFSGIAKNSFYIEDGKIKTPLTETMIAGNIQEVLKAIKGISMEQTDGMSSGKFPFMACSGVDISSGRAGAPSGMSVV